MAIVFNDNLSSNFGFYRNGWLPIGLADAAAFQQVLSMFGSHLRALYGHETLFSISESLTYHTRAITSVKERLSDPALNISDGMIGAVIGFACNAVRCPGYTDAKLTGCGWNSISPWTWSNGICTCGL